MKVRIAYTVEADDHLRRDINRFFGRCGLATREQIRDWFETSGRCTMPEDEGSGIESSG